MPVPPVMGILSITTVGGSGSILMTGYATTDTSPRDEHDGGARRPNVVWITLDSVRADHTTVAGYDRDTTPTLSRIAGASAGESFPNCMAHARYTLPSTASMLTGTYPSRHRLGYERKTVSPRLDTVAERFSDLYYHTDAVSVNDFVSDETGLHRGFESFDLLEPSTIHRTAGLRTLARFLLGIRRHSAGFDTDLHRHATAWLLTDVLKRRIRSYADRDRPVFLYAHYNETHMPYYPPRSHINRYADEIDVSAREAGEISMEIVDSLTETIANGCDLSAAELEALIAMYDAELRYTDERVGEVFDAVQSHLGDTIFVVTADHGEFLGERDLLGHKCVLDNTLLRVPLVTHRFPAIDASGLVQHTDVMATLLGCAGGNPESIQGVDLRTDDREYAISQDGPSTFDRFLQHNESFDASRFAASEVTAIQDDRFKLTVAEDRTSLFELPDELTDRSETYPEVAANMEAFVTEFLATKGAPVGGRGREAEYSEAMKSHLSDLGYVEDDLS